MLKNSKLKYYLNFFFFLNNNTYWSNKEKNWFKFFTDWIHIYIYMNFNWFTIDYRNEYEWKW